MNKVFIFLIAAFAFFSCNQQDTIWVTQSPAGEMPTLRNPSGETIIPNGRIVQPYGTTFETAPHPYGLILSPDGNIAVTANSGTSPLSVTILKDIFSKNPTIQQIPPGARTDKGVLAGVYMGLAIASDNETLYVAGGQENVVYVFNLQTGEKIETINCSFQNDSIDFSHGYIGDMVLSKDDKRLYVLDQINFRLVVLDTDSKTIIDQIPTGRYPFGVTFSTDENELFIANVGMYEYQWIKGFNREDPKNTSLDFPTAAYLSKESEEGFAVDSLYVPGLGKPNVPESFSVWTIDVASSKVTAKVNTGFLVGELIDDIPAVAGSLLN